VCLYVIIILLYDLTLLRCKTCAIDIGSLKATYLLTYLLISIILGSRLELLGSRDGINLVTIGDLIPHRPFPIDGPVTKPLSLTVSEIFKDECDAMTSLNGL